MCMALSEACCLKPIILTRIIPALAKIGQLLAALLDAPLFGAAIDTALIDKMCHTRNTSFGKAYRSYFY